MVQLKCKMVYLYSGNKEQKNSRILILSSCLFMRNSKEPGENMK